MTDFPLRVWAPTATHVDGVVGARRIALEPTGDGWWLSNERLSPGTDYKFSLDGGAPVPDPRSRSQPNGVDGPSRIVDPATFQWTDSEFVPTRLDRAVIYELHIGTFSNDGTFDGAIGHLDHLAALGVTHVELMPVAEFSGERGWGYDGVDLYAPHHLYGGPEGMARFVDAAHAKGVAVILDVVYNHLGPAGNYLTQFGPYFTDHYSTLWGSAVNFDRAGSDEVRRFFIDNALMWLRDYHVDGLRLDAVHAMFDMSAVHFLEQLGLDAHELGETLGRSKVIIAESDLNDPRLIRPLDQGGYGLDAQWSDDFHHALFTVLTGEDNGYYADFGTIEDLAITLTRGYRYAGEYSRHRRRRHGRPSPGLDGRRLVGYLQDHDQVGNRALGERSSQLMSARLLKIGAALVLTAPFVPMLFMGEEWAASTPFQYFTDHGDPQLGEAVRQGRKQEFAAFGWDPASIPDPQDVETFRRSQLRWDELSEPAHADMLGWYRSLISLRADYPELSDGNLEAVEVEFDEQSRWLALLRGRVLVAINFGEEVASLPCGGRSIRLSSTAGTERDGDRLFLAPESVALLIGD
ncbi:MAG TPA: malto-oligosyltrehalose trehalohydrolase [Candidatus Limnocylindrales bacterium]